MGFDPHQAVLHIEKNAGASLPGQLQREWPSKDVQDWVQSLAAADDADTPQIDWFVAIYHGPRADDGKPDTNLEAWCAEMFELVSMLHVHCRLQAAMLLCPESWPNPLQWARKFHQAVSMWQTSGFVLRKTSHGGSIETDHSCIALYSR